MKRHQPESEERQQQPPVKRLRQQHDIAVPPLSSHPVLVRPVEWEQLHHVYIEACGRFGSSLRSAWDTTQMTLKEAVQFHIVSIFRQMRELPFDVKLRHAVGDRLPPEMSDHIRTMHHALMGQRYPDLHVDRHRGCMPLLEELERHQATAYAYDPKAAPVLRGKCHRLFVGDLHVFAADEPPFQAEWGRVFAARSTVQADKPMFRSFAQAMAYLRRARAYFGQHEIEFGEREKHYAKKIALAFAATDNMDTNIQLANGELAEYLGEPSSAYWNATNAPFVSGYTEQPHNIDSYRRGWIKRRWLCDCMGDVSDDECPHVCWWPGNGPREVEPRFPRVIRPRRSFAEGVAKSTFGVMEGDPDFPDFLQHFYRLSDKGMHMERNHLVLGGEEFSKGKVELHREVGRRYEQALGVMTRWRDKLPERFERASAPQSPSNCILHIMCATVIRAVSEQATGDPIADRLQQRTRVLDEMKASNTGLSNVLDGYESLEHEAVCYPGDPSRAVPFETLVCDFSLPHKRDNHAIYTRHAFTHSSFDVVEYHPGSWACLGQWFRMTTTHITPVGALMRRCSTVRSV